MIVNVVSDYNPNAVGSFESSSPHPRKISKIHRDLGVSTDAQMLHLATTPKKTQSDVVLKLHENPPPFDEFGSAPPVTSAAAGGGGSASVGVLRSEQNSNNAIYSYAFNRQRETGERPPYAIDPGRGRRTFESWQTAENTFMSIRGESSAIYRAQTGAAQLGRCQPLVLELARRQPRATSLGRHCISDVNVASHQFVYGYESRHGY
ncbi:hypothetical protein EVAR_67123_1 [Eumeta japonica]|uniref:Uncharacterized protein n=1 Tax=Eumeta variegata TaxID=151549 RepID=A0A4C1ZTL5_EUMVA|nr:hypothetical protein EVAR_67123_1 [Eumeta japonica]